MGGRLDAVEIEGGLEHRLHRGHDHGEVGGLAARHDRVDRELLDAGLAPERRHEAEDSLRILAGARDHRLHPLGGGGHDGQPVAPVPLDELRIHVFFGHLQLADHGLRQGGLRQGGFRHGGFRHGDLPESD
jgi:hypothetical protein